MNPSPSHKLLAVLTAFICLAGMPLQTQAAKPIKSAKAVKERLVLMPLRVAEEDKALQGAMETALVEGLQQKYEVFSGEQVAQKARQIFNKESRNTAKKECDETRCMQGIAEAFQAELIATANVTKQSGGYFLALSVQNIFDNKVEYSKTLTCKGCDTFQVIDKLKELSGAPVAAAETEPPAPKFTATDPDSITWAEAQKGNTADDYQVYLDAYPKGKYIAFAKAKLKKLKEAEQALAGQQEQQSWETALQDNTQNGYSGYLALYPQGQFSALAQTRIDKLKRESIVLDSKQKNDAPSNSQESEVQCVFPNSDKSAPLWVCDGPVEGVAIGAVGSATKSNAGVDFMKQMAASEARVQLVQAFRAHVHSLIVQYANFTGVVSREVADRLGVSTSKQISDQTMPGVKIYRSILGPDGSVFVFVGLDEGTTQKLVESAVKASMNKDRPSWQLFRAQRGGDQLAAEISNLKAMEGNP